MSVNTYRIRGQITRQAIRTDEPRFPSIALVRVQSVGFSGYVGRDFPLSANGIDPSAAALTFEIKDLNDLADYLCNPEGFLPNYFDPPFDFAMGCDAVSNTRPLDGGFERDPAVCNRIALESIVEFGKVVKSTPPTAHRHDQLDPSLPRGVRAFIKYDPHQRWGWLSLPEGCTIDTSGSAPPAYGDRA